MKIKSLAVLLMASLVIVLGMSCMLFAPSGGPLKFDPATLPDAQAGVPYEARLVISGNRTPVIDFALSAGVLPTGLKLEKVENEDAARIFGTPQETGDFQFKVFAWCYGTNVSGQQGEQVYKLTVK